jgi:hypothetical protein
MNRRILLAMTLTLALVVLRASAFAQAAAESVLLGAGSATATVKAGSALSSALNSALNQNSKQLAGHVQRQMLQPTPGKMSQAGARPVSMSPVKATAVRAGTTPAQGALIASIQGAVTQDAVTGCAPTKQVASTPGSETAAESAQTNCSGEHSAGQPVPQKYKSVITVSFPK